MICKVYRDARGCEEMIYLLSERIRRKKKCFVGFLDLTKAFDCVSTKALLAKLHLKGVRGSLWRMINSLYQGRSSTVRTKGGESNSFRVNRGVRQGCVLSPILFAIYINDIFERVGAGTVHLFADDIVCICDTATQPQSTFDHIGSFLNDVGLYCSQGKKKGKEKCKVLVFGDDNRRSQVWNIQGVKVQEAKEYKYISRSLVPLK